MNQFIIFISPPETLLLASDRNFDKITNNFGKVLINERKLQADMQKVAQAMKSKLSAEQEVQKRLLSYHISINYQTIRSI